KAIELLRKQNEKLKHKHYFIKEIEESRWKIGHKDEEENHFITTSIVYRNPYEDLLFCNCQFYLQNQLPCRHMIILLDRNTDELYDQANKIQEVFSINKQWLKNPAGYYINEIDD
ncbi:unnamed protein product, partial [Didymodactylos carnosus]